jgi:hexosaminidase
MKRILITVCMTFMLSCGAALAQVANYDVVPLPKSINQTNAPGFVLGEQVAVLYAEGNAEMERNAHFLSDYVREMTHLQLACQAVPAKTKMA